jgi:hypothetical protein
MRWGGSGASYLMREAARSAELLGRYDLAEALYRRALPGGGMCGTTVHLRLAAQIAGAVRAAEQRGGCRTAVVERLYALARADTPYGTDSLARAGFDVPRLYAGALLMSGRDDVAALERALLALPSRSAEAVARLTRLGQEAWATRVRALEGYADTAKGAALPWLMALAAQGGATTRTEALHALGALAEDRGYDPCVPTRLGRIWGTHSGDGRREVRGIMQDCKTRLRAPTIDDLVQRVEAMAKDSDASVREAVANTLGRLGATRSRPVLKALSDDRFDAGGQVCTQRGSEPQVCERNRPVALAAREALDALKRADEARAKQQAAQAAQAAIGH